MAVDKTPSWLDNIAFNYTLRSTDRYHFQKRKQISKTKRAASGAVSAGRPRSKGSKTSSSAVPASTSQRARAGNPEKSLSGTCFPWNSPIKKFGSKFKHSFESWTFSEQQKMFITLKRSSLQKRWVNLLQKTFTGLSLWLDYQWWWALWLLFLTCHF